MRLWRRGLSFIAVFGSLAALAACGSSSSSGSSGGSSGSSGPPPFTNVSNSPGNSIQPAMVHGRLNGGKDEIFLVWTEVVLGHSDIYFTQTLQNGTQWRTTTTNVSNTVGSSANPKVGFGSVSVNSDMVVVVWDDTSLGDREILFSRKRDSGPFESPVNVSNSAGISNNPSIVFRTVSNDILVAWQEEVGANNEIFVARSIDGGVSFESPVNVSNTAAGSFLPSIVEAGNDLLVVWSESGATAKILAARSADGGMSFGTPFEVSGGVGVAGAAALSVEGGRVVVAWTDLSDIYEAHSTDYGLNFAAPVNISNDPGLSISAAAAIGSDTFLAWEDVASNEIFLAKVVELIPPFVTTVNLSGTDASAGGSGGSFPPAVALIGSTAYVAWSDNTQSTSIDLVVKTHTF